jgi:hypothetical protein
MTGSKISSYFFLLTKHSIDQGSCFTMTFASALSAKKDGNKNGTTSSRTSRAIAPRLVTPVKARSVVATRRRAKAILSGS